MHQILKVVPTISIIICVISCHPTSCLTQLHLPIQRNSDTLSNFPLLSHSPSHRTTNDRNDDDISTTNAIGGPPYSQAYPRHRISLTRDSSKKSPFPQPPNPLLRLKLRLSQSALSKSHGGHLLWHEYWGPSAGLSASATFWRTAYQLLDSSGGETTTTTKTALALPSVPVGVAMNLVEINDYLKQEGFETVNAIIDADSSDIPVIIMTIPPTTSSHPPPPSHPPTKTPPQTTLALRSWVRRLLVRSRICPFTKSDIASGQGLSDANVPVARIAYHHSSGTPHALPRLLSDAWSAIDDMIQAGPDAVSSILLAAPAFDDDFELWGGRLFAVLESGVAAARAEGLVGVVCFHPRYAVSDGTGWPGFGHMHSVPRLRGWVEEVDGGLAERLGEEEVAMGGAWQRRTPHAVINVLRADQLEMAEGKRRTRDLYTRNIRVLMEEVGVQRLVEDLRKERDI